MQNNMENIVFVLIVIILFIFSSRMQNLREQGRCLESRFEKLERKSMLFVKDFKTSMLHPRQNCVEVPCKYKSNWAGLTDEEPVYFLKGTEPDCDYVLFDTETPGAKFIKNNLVEVDCKGKPKK